MVLDSRFSMRAIRHSLCLVMLWCLSPPVFALQISFHEMFDRHPSIMLLSDPATGVIVRANDAALAFYGYDRNTLIGMPMGDLAESTNQQLRIERETAITEERRYFLFRHLTSTGDSVPVKVFALPVSDSGKTYLHWIVFDLRDAEATVNKEVESVSSQFVLSIFSLVGILILLVAALIASTLSRKKASALLAELRSSENALTTTTERYNSLVSHIPDGTYRTFLDASGHRQFQFVSSRFCELMRVEESEILSDGDLILESVHPSDRERLIAETGKAYTSGLPFRWEGRFVFGDETRWIRFASDPEQDKDDNRVWNGVISDITDSKNSYFYREIANDVFKFSRDGIIISDLQHRITFVNESFTRLTGYRSEECKGLSLELLDSGRHGHEFFKDIWDTIHQSHYWSGEIWNRHKSGQSFLQKTSISIIFDSEGQPDRYLHIFSDITSERSHELELERIAHYDSLTGLPNRLLLVDRLEHAMKRSNRDGTQLAVLYIDLDKFKQVNDTYGHVAGDELLIQVTQNMQHCLREGDTLARIGGDEFVAILPDMDKEHSYLGVIDRVLHAATEPVDVGVATATVSASIGVSTYPQSEPIQADRLVRQADQAMYQAKVSGKNRIHHFNLDHEQVSRSRHKIIEELKLAIERDELELYYQPIIDLREKYLFGVEGLIRWHHPELGTLSPIQFLPEIENHPLISDIGDWVIRSALKQQELWINSGLEIHTSVNIAALHLQKGSFLEDLEQELKKHPVIQSNMFTIEILESSLIADLDSAADITKSCIDCGINVSLDDFGTGYSSLVYLKQINANQLKIDKEFVASLFESERDLVIVQGIISMARRMSLDVIAEGVESLELGEALNNLGVRYLQGYAIAHPMPASQIAVWNSSFELPEAWRHQPSSSTQYDCFNVIQA